MSTVISIICAILIFCVIVVVHEFGHFIVARKCGIDVKEFAIGMGPAIFKKQGKNTLFTIRILPCPLAVIAPWTRTRKLSARTASEISLCGAEWQLSQQVP